MTLLSDKFFGLGDDGLKTRHKALTDLRRATGLARLTANGEDGDDGDASSGDGALVVFGGGGDAGGDGGVGVAKTLGAHLNGGAVGALFESQYALAELARAHASYSAQAPPPVARAPLPNVAMLEEKVELLPAY